jgi:hypothetical protein
MRSQLEIKHQLEQMNVHPRIIRDYLTQPDGSLRLPCFEEWTEDYGLGQLSKYAWEKDQWFDDRVKFVNSIFD